ncbi:MAG: 2TM domain-containing protein [candidate division WOR-3 bacterium]|nr:MAG: 2TM domain-containing protein [candidate division WOR-3 bacterium]
MKQSKKSSEKYKVAKRRVVALRGFYAHLFMYIIVNIVLILINFIFTPRFLWFLFPLLGWGVGLLAHAVFGFGLFGFFTKEWEERKIKEIIEQEGNKK